jgi:hypothetical protein
MFDLADKRLVWIPIKWPGVKPGANEGDVAQNTTHQIECQVELVDADRLKELFPKGENLGATSEKVFDAFKALVHDWRGVKIGTTSAPMTDENIRKILRVPMFASGFEGSYVDAWTGQLEEREKNSGDSSADGQAGEASAAPGAGPK